MQMYTENVDNYEVFKPLILQKDDNFVSKIKSSWLHNHIIVIRFS